MMFLKAIEKVVICIQDIQILQHHILGQAIAEMEETEGSILTSSGMAAITTTILELCNSGDEVISSQTIYGGSFAFMQKLFT